MSSSLHKNCVSSSINPTRNNMVEYTTGFETDFLFLLHDEVLP